jgi:hypothetical protein
MAPPLAQSSPPGKEEQGRRESERRERCVWQRFKPAPSLGDDGAPPAHAAGDRESNSSGANRHQALGIDLRREESTSGSANRPPLAREKSGELRRSLVLDSTALIQGREG